MFIKWREIYKIRLKALGDMSLGSASKAPGSETRKLCTAIYWPWLIG